MSALKQRTSAIGPTALGVAIIWLACLVFLIPLHPKASQANKTYQLSAFTSYAFDLVGSLQNEMFLAVGSQISNDNASPKSNLIATQRTAMARHNIAKNWGRFDSTPFGKPFRNQIEMAFTRLDAIDRSLMLGRDSKTPPLKTARSYAAAIGGFLTIEPYFDELKISEAKTDLLRKNFSKSLKLTQLMETEFLSGLGILVNEPPDPKKISEWAAVTERRKTLLQSLAPGTQPGHLPAETMTANVDDVQAAATLGDRFLSLVQEGKKTDYPGTSIWVATYSKGLAALAAIAHDNRARMSQRASAQVQYTNVIFIIAVVIAAMLTILFLVWRNYRDPAFLFLVLFISINIPFLWWGLTAGSEFLADEGSVLETAQAVTLIVALGLFCSDAVKFDQPSRSAALILACVCLFMFFREMDFRTFGAPDWIIGLSSGPGRRVLFFVGASAVILYALRHYRNLLALVPSGLSFKAWPFYAWPILLLLGELVELLTHATRKDDLHGYWVTGQLWEEMLELDAYLVLAYAAYMFGDIIRNGKSAKQPVK